MLRWRGVGGGEYGQHLNFFFASFLVKFPTLRTGKKLKFDKKSTPGWRKQILVMTCIKSNGVI